VSRRVRVPAAEELFRTTGPAAEIDGADVAGPAARDRLRAVPDVVDAAPPRAGRRPSGRERHQDKITVYVSARELLDLEQARLTLRGEYGLPVDRGRLVREAVAAVLEEFDALGEASTLVRRLRRA
jgi:hypothetical protein